MGRLAAVICVLVVVVAETEFGREPYDFVVQKAGKDLDSWKPIRISTTVSYSNTWQQYNVREIEALVAKVHHYYAQFLAVHRYERNLSFSDFNYCGTAQIPSSHQTEGVQADIVFYVMLTEYGSSSESAFICLYDLIDQNPVAVFITLPYSFYSSPPKDALQQLINLYGKGLGFGAKTSLFAREPDGPVTDDTDFIYDDRDDSGQPIRRLRSPTVLTLASRTFNSYYSTGIPLSNKTVDIEFSMRAMFGDIMSDTPLEFKYQLSIISLAVFQDLGWYKVDFSRGSRVVFGAEKDRFLETNCTSGKFPEFCNPKTVPSLSSCDPYHLRKTTCNLSNTNGCGIFYSVARSDSCKSSTPLSPLEGEETCPECRCFNTSLTKSKAASYRPLCHRVICADTKAKVEISGATVDCPISGGTVSVPGMAGYLECPPFEILCGDFGCPSFCNGAGRCTAGRCVCDEFSFGIDCTLPCPERCTTCTGNTCSTCVVNASVHTLSSGVIRCQCNPGYFYNEKNNQCEKCDVLCATCEKSPGNCLTCVNSFALSGGKCVCAKDAFLSPTEVCIPCDNSCKECVLSASNCLACNPGFLLTELNKCICPLGNYIDPVKKTCSLCSSLCLTCSSATVCTSCAPRFELRNGTCEKQDVEPEDGWGKCGDCYWTCKVCAEKPNVCSSCITSLFSIHSVYGICTLNAMKETSPGLSPTFPDFLTRDPTYKFECSGDTTRCSSISKRGYYFTGDTYLKLGPNKRSEAVYLNSEFAVAFFVRIHPSKTEAVLLSKVADSGAEFIVLGLSKSRSLHLKLAMRSYGNSLMCENKTVEINSDVVLKTDVWHLLWFQLEARAATGTSRSGTLVSLLLEQTVMKQVFYEELLYEDVPVGVGQSFVVGGLWTETGVSKTFAGYLGEFAVKKRFTGKAVPCDCKQCTFSPGVCLSDCNFDEQDNGTSCQPL